GHMESLGPGVPAPDGSGATVELADGTFVHGGLGARFRLLDDRSGYANQPGGNLDGSLWLSTHVGAMAWHGPQLAIDLALGYELSISRPFSLGMFARGVLGL